MPVNLGSTKWRQIAMITRLQDEAKVSTVSVKLLRLGKIWLLAITPTFRSIKFKTQPEQSRSALEYNYRLSGTKMKVLCWVTLISTLYSQKCWVWGQAILIFSSHPCSKKPTAISLPDQAKLEAWLQKFNRLQWKLPSRSSNSGLTRGSSLVNQTTADSTTQAIKPSIETNNNL